MPDDAKLTEMGTCATAWAVEYRDAAPATISASIDWFAAFAAAIRSETAVLAD